MHVVILTILRLVLFVTRRPASINTIKTLNTAAFLSCMPGCMLSGAARLDIPEQGPLSMSSKFHKQQQKARYSAAGTRFTPRFVTHVSTDQSRHQHTLLLSSILYQRRVRVSDVMCARQVQALSCDGTVSEGVQTVAKELLIFASLQNAYSELEALKVA